MGLLDASYLTSETRALNEALGAPCGTPLQWSPVAPELAIEQAVVMSPLVAARQANCLLTSLAEAVDAVAGTSGFLRSREIAVARGGALYFRNTAPGAEGEIVEVGVGAATDPFPYRLRFFAKDGEDLLLIRGLEFAEEAPSPGRARVRLTAYGAGKAGDARLLVADYVTGTSTIRTGLVLDEKNPLVAGEEPLLAVTKFTRGAGGAGIVGSFRWGERRGEATRTGEARYRPGALSKGDQSIYRARISGMKLAQELAFVPRDETTTAPVAIPESAFSALTYDVHLARAILARARRAEDCATYGKTLKAAAPQAAASLPDDVCSGAVSDEVLLQTITASCGEAPSLDVCSDVRRRAFMVSPRVLDVTTGADAVDTGLRPLLPALGVPETTGFPDAFSPPLRLPAARASVLQN